MKKPTSLLILTAFSLMPLLMQAKIWRVNNTGAPADFTTAQTAINSGTVVNGDTVHIEPSGTTYGPIALTKRLVIIGNGYLLGSIAINANPGLQANTAVSRITSNLVVYASGSGSVIMGLTIDNVYIGWDAVTSNVIFKRNHCETVQTYSGGTNNVMISQNYINSFMGGTAGSHTNLIITNNIVGAYVQFDANDNGLFANNIFCTNQGSWLQLTGFTVRNNIRVQAQPGTSLTNCIVQNNMDCTGGSIFGNTEGNLANIDMGNVFMGWPTIGPNSTDGRLALKNGSLAAGAGYNGADMGAILNASNNNNNLADTYVLSGIPNVPSVFKLDAPVTVNTSTMNVTVSTRTNN
jgi:hypothetical protein